MIKFSGKIKLFFIFTRSLFTQTVSMLKTSWHFCRPYLALRNLTSNAHPTNSEDKNLKYHYYQTKR